MPMDADLPATLRAVADAEETDIARVGTAVDRSAEIAFVYSGNGSQWVGMGREAYDRNAIYRSAFDRIDVLFAEISCWSLKEALFADDLAERMVLTRVSQPLIFAISSASTTA